MNAFYKHGFQIQAWKKYSPTPHNKPDDLFFIDKHTSLSYIDFDSIKGRIFFLNNKVPAYANEKCIALDLHNCVDNYRFYESDSIFPQIQEYVAYSHRQISDKHKQDLCELQDILIAGPQNIESIHYIGNLKDHDVINFCKSGTVYNYDDYILPELLYYGCQIYYPKDMIPTTYTNKLIGEYGEYWIIP